MSAFSFTVPEEENPSGSAEEPGEVTRMFDTMRSNEDSQPGPVPPPVMVTRSATGESHVAASGSTSGISAARPPDPLGFNNPFEEEFVAKPPVPPAASRSADPLGFGTPFVEEDEPSAPATQEPGEVTRMFDTMRGNDDSQPGPVPPPVMVTRSATGESHVAATSPPSAKPVSAFSFTVPEEENPSGSAEEPGEVTRMFDTMRSNEDSQPAPVPPPVIVTRSATGESHVAATSPPASPADARAAMFGNPNEFEKAEPTVQLDAEPSAPVAAPAPDPTLHSWMNVVEANPALSELPSAEEDRGGSRTLITVSPFYEGGDPKAAPAVLEPKPAPKGFQGLGAAPQPAVAAYRETTLPPQGPAPAPVGPPPAPAPPAPNVTLPPFDSEEVPEFLREVSPVKPADTTDVMRNPYFAPAGSAARLGAAAPLMADRIRTETSQPAVQVNLEEAEEIEMEQAEKTVQVRAPAPPPLMPTATPGALVDLPPPRPTLVQAPQPVQQFEPVLGADEHTLQQDAGPEFDEVKSSNMLLVAGLIAGAALLGGAAWFFLFRETDKPEQTVPAEPSAAESAPAPTPAKPESPPEAAPTPALAPEKPSAPNIPGGPRELTREQIRDELFGQGNRLYHEGEYEKAIEKYKEVVQVDANYAIVHRTLGSCYALLDMPVEACASYARYLELALDAPDRDKVQEEIDRCRKPVKKGKKKGR
ncbi:MAG: hypothetical protein GMKNLPBB_00747 [Myxococcota bacterium]|nr:hypothetical protein [Myxococcota bacterium]